MAGLDESLFYVALHEGVGVVYQTQERLDPFGLHRTKMHKRVGIASVDNLARILLNFGVMKPYWTVLALSLLWAQEESRARTEAPATRSTTTRAVVTRPTPQKEEIVVMETLSGQVVDKSGTGQGNVLLRFVDKSTGKVLGETRTSSDGGFALVLPASAQVVLVRMSRDGKAFSEKEYPLSELLQSEPEFVIEP